MCLIELVIKAINDGKETIIAKEGDLVLDNFGILWTVMIQEWEINQLFSLKNTGGTLKNFWSVYGQWSWNGKAEAGYGGQIAVGTGTVSPAPSDYCLGNQIASGPNESPTYFNGTITFVRTFTWGTPQSITEAGVIWTIRKTGTPWNESILMFRDTFEEVTGGTISVIYRLSLS